MLYLFKHESQFSLMALALCVLVFCIHIQWNKGARALPWVLGTLGVGAIALAMLTSFRAFAPGNHAASSGTAYSLLGGVLAVMLNAARKLRAEREATRLS